MAITRKAEAQYRNWKAEETKIMEGRPVRFSDICVHEFRIGDVDDPEIYAAEPIWNWQQSEAGQWVMANASEPPYWISSIDYQNWGNKFKIMARLSDQNQTYFKLKFSS